MTNGKAQIPKFHSIHLVPISFLYSSLYNTHVTGRPRTQREDFQLVEDRRGGWEEDEEVEDELEHEEERHHKELE